MALVGLECPVPSHCIPLPQLEGLGVQGIHTCSGSVRCTSPSGDCPATSHMGENTPRCCTSHQHPQPPAPARQGSPGCFPCTPNLPLSGLAGACTVSFGSSRNLTPAERKACPTAGCLSTVDCFQNPVPLVFYQSIHPSPILQFPATCNNPEPRRRCLGFYYGCRRVYSSLPCSHKKKESLSPSEAELLPRHWGMEGQGRPLPPPGLLPFHRLFPSSKFCD